MGTYAADSPVNQDRSCELCSEFAHSRFRINYLPESLEILRTSVALIDIVCMFPHVTSKKRGGAYAPGVAGNTRVDDISTANRLFFLIIRITHHRKQ
jgi:hypothetical protein